jgi:hypothetical protein
MTPDFMPPPAAVPMDPQALPPGLQTIPQVDGQGAQDAAALQNALKVEGASGEGTGTGFFDKLRTDPKLSQAMLVMGSALMQGPKPGQDQFGLFGNAMMAGALTHNMLTLNEGVDQRATQESDARVAESGQRVKASEQKMEQDAALHPVMMDKYKQEVEQARTAGDLNRVRMLGEELRNGNYQKKFESEMANDAAGRASHYASAGASNERRLASVDERKYKEVLASPTSTPEERERARSALNQGTGGGQAASDRLEMEFQQMKKAHPTPPKGVSQAEHEQRLREMVVRGSHQVKGQDLASIRLAMTTAANAGDDAGYQAAKAQLDEYQRQANSDRAWLRGEVTDGKTAPPAAPTDKKALVKGSPYTLPDGRVGTWDGKNFNLQQGK